MQGNARAPRRVGACQHVNGRCRHSGRPGKGTPRAAAPVIPHAPRATQDGASRPALQFRTSWSCGRSARRARRRGPRPPDASRLDQGGTATSLAASVGSTPVSPHLAARRATRWHAAAARVAVQRLRGAQMRPKKNKTKLRPPQRLRRGQVVPRHSRQGKPARSARCRRRRKEEKKEKEKSGNRAPGRGGTGRWALDGVKSGAVVAGVRRSSSVVACGQRHRHPREAAWAAGAGWCAAEGRRGKKKRSCAPGRGGAAADGHRSGSSAPGGHRAARAAPRRRRCPPHRAPGWPRPGCDGLGSAGVWRSQWGARNEGGARIMPLCMW
jgi:hypothetical protein